jgi:hypothetical protein
MEQRFRGRRTSQLQGGQEAARVKSILMASEVAKVNTPRLQRQRVTEEACRMV